MATIPTNLANRIAGDGGTYSLQMDFSNADLNGNIAHARTDINLGDTFTGVIGGDGFLDGNGQPGLVSVGSRDVDFFRFTPTQSGVLEVDTQGQQFVLHAGSTYVDDSGTSYGAHAGYDLRARSGPPSGSSTPMAIPWPPPSTPAPRSAPSFRSR